MKEPLERELAVFSAARRLSAGERPVYLDQACAGNPALRQRVEDLLRANEEAAGFLQGPAPGAQPPAHTFVFRNLPGIQHAFQKRFGDYELQEEIARGGMGVVYKARQVSLNRTVAVKMIIAGEFASKDFVRRFLAEAQATAALQHPNIVAIHEVGEHAGQHFFSMDYVQGRNLAEMARDAPLPVERAARYVKIIAEAIHYAHEQGTLHRDLKPSNVLIDGDDQPRITDFGLAKRFQSSPEFSARESQLTITGQILGSPNFMPPEQAGGKEKHGRHSDVYGLGGILFYLITGRPPFDGLSVAETLDQVLNSDPVSPLVFRPSVPEDIGTICLKCLEKNPTKRYATAQEVAGELARFLDDVPILARRLSKTNFSHTFWAETNYSRQYREHADNVIVERAYLFHVLKSFIQHFGVKGDLRICDLGCGDGSLAEQLLAMQRNLHLTLIDAAPEMLAAARHRLGDRPNVHLVEATFDAVIRGEVEMTTPDFIVSSFAIHHLSQAERVALFHRIHDRLPSGGWFVNIDTVLPDEPVFADWHYDLWREWIVESERIVRSEQSFRQKPDEARANPDNKLSPLTAQLRALRAASFVDVECHYRNGIFAIYSGRKPMACATA